MKWLTHPDDCRRVQEVCLKHNWDISLSEADVMWGRHSMGQSIPWSKLPQTPQDIWLIIEPQLDRLMGEGDGAQDEPLNLDQIKIEQLQTTEQEENMNYFEYKLKCNRCLTVLSFGTTPLEENGELFHSLLTNQPQKEVCLKCKTETDHTVTYLSRNGEPLEPEAPMPEDTRFKLTMEILQDPTKRSQVIAEGTIPNSPEGIYMTNSNRGQMLRWVLKTGGGYADWAVYVHWATHSTEYIMENGDKVTMKSNLTKIIDFDEECWKKYRF